MKLLAPILLLAAIPATFGQIGGRAPQTFDIVGKDGDLALRNLATQRYARNADGTVTFTVGGAPAKGEWKARGLTMEANRMTVITQDGASGPTSVVRATIEGGRPWFEVLQPSAANAQTNQTIRLESPKVDYTATTETIVLAAPVQAVGRDAAAGRLWNLNGQNGKAVLYPREPKRADGAVVRSFDLAGPVTFSLESTTQRAGAAEKTTYKGSCNRLVFDDATKQIRLTGKVLLETDRFTLSGGKGAESALVQLDDQLKVVSVELSGSPGESRMQGGGR